MKELIRPLFAWFVSIFNVGIYKFNVINDLDSLILELQKNGVEQQANELVHLYELLTYQQEILLILDVFKVLFMLLSIVFLFIINQPIICRFFRAFYAKCAAGYTFLKNLF